ncbi:MAG TPA: carboxypeptidase-like regulatory domain-containing protein, partial [Candidatus Polarisedimenticolia bacterium]|nr:carboxypeptidase-like regulatory domain-containing protein [Candidatus Polarisedimenticolia bacterium]
MFGTRGPAGARRRAAAVVRAVTGAAGALILVCLAAGFAPLLADESGGLLGLVSDLQGQPLAGVTVVASEPSGGMAERGAVTGADGTFRIAGLPPASTYTLKFSLDGFATVLVSGAEVRAREITRVDALLTPAKSLRETVQVRATPPIVALEETATRTRFSSEFIDNLPILGR